MNPSTEAGQPSRPRRRPAVRLPDAIRPRGSRGAAEIVVTAVAAALIAAVLLGTGFAQTALNVSDGLAWLSDDHRGEVVQVNPSTGRPENRLAVAPPGDTLVVSQRDGLLVVTDSTSGLVTVIDVATLATAGRYRGSDSDRTMVLLGETELYVVDRRLGIITRLDPATAAVLGRSWAAGRSLADAAIDRTGTVWALTEGGTLHRLIWSERAATLVDASAPRRMTGTGPASVLIAHDAGVTVVAPETGTIIGIGTGNEATVAAPGLTTPLAAAETAPADLVPVSSPSTDTVTVLTDHRHALTIDVGRFDCPRPGPPAVYHGQVYVPCDNGKVLVLSRDGSQVRDIPVRGEGRPTIVLDDDLLYLNVPAGTAGLVVDQNGTVHEVGTFDGTVEVQDPDENAAAEPSLPPTREPQPPRNPGGDNGSGPPGGTTSPTPSPSYTLPAPTNVTATAMPDGRVVVAWQDNGGADEFVVLRADNATAVANVDGSATTATVTTVPAGTTTTFVVRASDTGGYTDSAPSNLVTVMGPADAPSGVGIEVNGATASSLTVTVRWTASVSRGAAVTGYRVALSTGVANAGGVVSPASTSAQYVLGCAGDCRYSNASIAASVTAESQSGDSIAGSAGYEYVGGPVPQPADGDVVVTTYLEEPSCPRMDQSCRILRYQYTAVLNPPETWRQFAGTCRLAIVGPSSTTYQAIGCTATSAYLFSGNGYTYTVSAQACNGTCVTSSPLTIYTVPPEQIWCGEYLC